MIPSSVTSVQITPYGKVRKPYLLGLPTWHEEMADPQADFIALLAALPRTLRFISSSPYVITSAELCAALPPFLEAWEGLHFANPNDEAAGFKFPPSLTLLDLNRLYLSQVDTLPSKLRTLHLNDFEEGASTALQAKQLSLTHLHVGHYTAQFERSQLPSSGIFHLFPCLKTLDIHLRYSKTRNEDWTNLWPPTLTTLRVYVRTVVSPLFWTSFPDNLTTLDVRISTLTSNSFSLHHLPRSLTFLRLCVFDMLNLNNEHILGCPPELRVLELQAHSLSYTAQALARAAQNLASTLHLF